MRNASASVTESVTCIIPTDVRMFRDVNGNLRASHAAGRYQQWQPFAESFTAVVVVARTSDVGGSDCGSPEGAAVTVSELPDYQGYRQLIRRLPTLTHLIWRIPLENSVPIVRLPEPLSVLFCLRCRLTKQPYVAMVVADIVSAARAHSGHPNRRSVRLFSGMLGKFNGWLVRGASGTIYVTEEYLQRRYPSAPGVPLIVRSNVSLRASEISGARSFPRNSRNLVAVGTQQTNIKGHDTAIESLRHLRMRDARYRLVLVGGGAQQATLRRLADEAGVAEHVVFTGQLETPADVRKVLDAADLFLMPSRSEGLPRALIEAMATGLPAVGSAVGGIPELLPPDCLVPPDNADALSAAVERIFDQPETWESLSRLSVSVASRIEVGTRPEALRVFLDLVLLRVRASRRRGEECDSRSG